MVMREVHHRHNIVHILAQFQYLFQGSEHVLLSRDLNSQLGLDLRGFPPVHDLFDIHHYVVVDILTVGAFVVKTQIGDHCVPAQCVGHYGCELYAVDALVGEIAVGSEVHVVGGVHGHAYVQPLGHPSHVVEVSEGPGDT
ncbi:hypothetical protein SDC9_128078 [bioreactor metagenome]|uniref:Uncharacterized protein n=1 Tax=bioreactor metagenome TaxID=1076179 RepID=A0A645CVT4_9ZZZZ